MRARAVWAKARAGRHVTGHSQSTPLLQERKSAVVQDGAGSEGSRSGRFSSPAAQQREASATAEKKSVDRSLGQGERFPGGGNGCTASVKAPSVAVGSRMAKDRRVQALTDGMDAGPSTEAGCCVARGDDDEVGAWGQLRVQVQAKERASGQGPARVGQ
ncbi:hypothetical protein AXG93_857s1300 [Marchantia polymorpha subsp. ruderalis]|uniref:Uncharacterized protein n=1 Tax=Marchantia polymorpha subsp. ruderalis TaxID=1480154 RepID=A0A176WCG8_MARPO|nr:hypothetical protein AXG93_857s1300 [Marchantia polymorpha subsp. ruderalis]